MTAIAFAPDGSRIVLGRHSGGAAAVNDTAPVELATVVPRWAKDHYRYMPAITADGRHMVTLSGQLEVRVVRDDGRVRATFRTEEPAGGKITRGASPPRRAASS